MGEVIYTQLRNSLGGRIKCKITPVNNSRKKQLEKRMKST